MTVESIQEGLIELLKRSLSVAPIAVSTAKSACRIAGISEEEIRRIIDETLESEQKWRGSTQDHC
jgi:hypothetical protein